MYIVLFLNPLYNNGILRIYKTKNYDWEKLHARFLNNWKKERNWEKKNLLKVESWDYPLSKVSDGFAIW